MTKATEAEAIRPLLPRGQRTNPFDDSPERRRRAAKTNRGVSNPDDGGSDDHDDDARPTPLGG